MSRTPDNYQAAAARAALLQKVATFPSRPERESSLVAAVSLPSPVIAPRDSELPLTKQLRVHVREIHAMVREISEVYGERLLELAAFIEVHQIDRIPVAALRGIPNLCGTLYHATEYRLSEDRCALMKVRRNNPLRRVEAPRLAA